MFRVESVKPQTKRLIEMVEQMYGDAARLNRPLCRGRSRRQRGAARRLPGRVRKVVRQGPGDAAGHLPQDRQGFGKAMTADTFNDRSASATALAVAILWQSALLAGLVA